MARKKWHCGVTCHIKVFGIGRNAPRLAKDDPVIAIANRQHRVYCFDQSCI